MTEQEAEELSARLAQIWKPHGKVWWRINYGTTLQYSADIQPHVRLRCLAAKEDYHISLGLGQGGEEGMILLSAPDEFSAIITTPRSQQFANQWWQLFRRNCFLLGYNNDATAHEKAEWIQGFSREEIEAWGLKF